MREPNFILVGAPKCGTSAMWHYLGQHPDVYTSARKELQYLASDIPLRWRLTREQHRAHFSAARDETRVGTAWVWYLSSQNAARELSAEFPQARILIMLRDPVDMLYSLHSQLLYAGYEDITDFAEALAAEPMRRAGDAIPTFAKRAEWPSILYYREHVTYATQVRRFLDAFGKDCVHVMLYDHFVKDPAAVYAGVLRFLAVDDTHVPSFAVVNPNKQVRSRRLAIMLTHPPRALTTIARATLPASARHSLRRTARWIKRNVNSKYAPRPTMDARLRSRLRAEFSDEVTKLAELLDRDLTCWSTD